MTSQVIHTLPPMGIDLAMPSATNAAACPPVVWRRRGTLEALIGLSWIVGITGTCLAVGIIGMFAADLPPIHLRSLADLENLAEAPMIETSMAELQTLDATEQEVTPDESVLPVEIPDAIETPPENLDLPEIAEAMTVEDIFAIPTAPRIEDALRPVDPVVKPKPPPAPTRTRTPTTAGTRSSTQQAGAPGGTGGTTGTGRGKFPTPPYPGFARSAGMQGTVRLSISVGPSGAVESVTVTSSTGYSSLDDYAASWVRRNWRWPGGAASRYTLPLTFRLR